MKFEYIKKNFENELNKVNEYIENNLKSDIDIINNISTYLISKSGKRIRPLINLIFSKMFNSFSEKNIIMSSAIELIHAATLLHDDVVDLSEKRRGKLTVNQVWGNKESILVGDYLYTKSFKMLVNINNLNILKLMSHVTNIMSEGEINQLINKKNININKSDYFKIVRCKTAELFGASSLSSAILAKRNKKELEMSYKFGLHFGLAYQLIDDILDYFTEDENFGKNICDDIFSGTITLPLINLLNNNTYAKKTVHDLLFNDKKTEFLKIKNLIINSNSLDKSFNLALYHIDKAKEALSVFNKCFYFEILINLINFTIDRKY